jgi:nucleoside-diphosphate-sugar epimerase
MNRAIFVTGATGFLGGYLAREAVTAGFSVHALSRPQSSVPRDESLIWHESAMAAVEPAAFEGCEALFHCAAAGVSPQKAGWEELLAVNVIESLCLWRTAWQGGVRRFYLCGTALEYGTAADRYDHIPPDAPLEPITPYAASKAAATLTARAFAFETGVEAMVFRPFVVFGEGQHPANFWPSLRRAALAGEDFPMSPGGQVCDFFEASLAARSILKFLDEPLPPGKLVCRNIGSGMEQSLLDFACSWWSEWSAAGELLVGALPYRSGQIMRLVPKL